MKILWGSPLPPTRSGVSDYAVELLAELGARATVRVLKPPGHITADFREFVNGVRIVPTDTEPDADEVSLIHIGNNPHHGWLLDRLRFPNTVAVVHDLVLHHLLVEATAGDDALLETRLREAHGEAGAALARARRYGVMGRRDPFLFPARGAFLGSAKGVIVHSLWAEGVMLREFPDLPRLRVGLAVADPGKVLPVAERGRLGLVTDEVVLMHLGFLTPEKGLEQILTAIAAASRAAVPVRLVLVGEGKGMKALRVAATAVGVQAAIEETGWVSPEAFPAIPAAADLGVVLRRPTAGETSAAVVRFLAAGTPVAVGGTRQFLEWPELAVPRLTPGPSAPAELARLLAAAWKGRGAWQERRRAARAAYEANHRPADAADAIVQFLTALMA
jgi:glycosyltransferase involved in cell wall biosynthesis